MTAVVVRDASITSEIERHRLLKRTPQQQWWDEIARLSRNFRCQNIQLDDRPWMLLLIAAARAAAATVAAALAAPTVAIKTRTG